MSRLWKSILDLFNEIGNNSGCHQIPERCFKIKEYAFPICARCTGVMVGQIFAVFTILIGYRIKLVYSIILLLTMGFDWFIQHIKLLESNNVRRLLTGMLGGFGIINIYFAIIVIIYNAITAYFY